MKQEERDITEQYVAPRVLSVELIGDGSVADGAPLDESHYGDPDDDTVKEELVGDDGDSTDPWGVKSKSLWDETW